jgi:hypothetical protein
MTRAGLFARAFTGAELQKIQHDCAQRILDGQGQSAFVASSSAGGRSAAMLMNYSSEDLLEIVIEAQDIQNGKLLDKAVTYISFGGTY